MLTDAHSENLERVAPDPSLFFALSAILFPLAMARTTAAATAATALFLGRDAARASALKPAFSEIYQTTTPPTTAADGVLDTGVYSCGPGEWTLVGTSCYQSTTGDKNYFDALAECDSFGGWPFTPANVDDLNSLYSFTTATKIWTGIKSTDGEPAWKDYVGNDPSFYSWPNPLSPADPASGQCISVEGEGEYFSRSCSTALETSTMVCTKVASLNDGGDTPVDSGPPASVNGGGGGSLGVPFNGEIALYRQFLDPSTGVENAYLYPELKFVEADEAIHRAGLVSVSSLFLFPSSPFSSSSIHSTLLCRPLSRETLSRISMPPPTPPLLKAKCITSKASTAPGLFNKS
jgi:hypothetical protein